MSDRLPPLTALRAFDAAARHLSFAKAAEELHVTPAALSFQIKSLEAHLGHPVFRRRNRAIDLTPAGRALLPGVSEGFGALNAAWQAALRQSGRSILTVTAGPAFTAKWLAPKLFDFSQAHPEIELRFSATVRLLDFSRDNVDLAIRFGNGGNPGLFSEPIIHEWLTPMMAPALAEKVRHPEDLRSIPLFHQDDIASIRPTLDWQAWFDAAGLGPVPAGGTRFSQADHAMDAALSGAGAILGRVSLAAQALETGQLATPFDLAIYSDAHYRFVCPVGTEDQPQVAAFRSWVTQQSEHILPLSEGRQLVRIE